MKMEVATDRLALQLKQNAALTPILGQRWDVATIVSVSMLDCLMSLTSLIDIVRKLAASGKFVEASESLR